MSALINVLTGKRARPHTVAPAGANPLNVLDIDTRLDIEMDIETGVYNCIHIYIYI